MDYPGGLVVKKPPSSAWAWVQSLVGELRSHIPWGNYAQAPLLLSQELWNLHSAQKIPHAASKTWHSQINNFFLMEAPNCSGYRWFFKWILTTQDKENMGKHVT